MVSKYIELHLDFEWFAANLELAGLTVALAGVYRIPTMIIHRRQSYTLLALALPLATYSLVVPTLGQISSASRFRFQASRLLSANKIVRQVTTRIT